MKHLEVDLPNAGVIPLRNDAPRFWKPTKALDSTKDSRNGQVSVALRILGDVLANGAQVSH